MYELGSEFGDAEVAPGTNILVSGPPLSGKRRVAMGALGAGAEAGEGSVVVATQDSAERVREDFETLAVSDPEGPFGVVDCVTKHQGRSASDTETVSYTSSPVDMTGIGIDFSEFIERFSERGVARTRVLLDSLSTLLLYSDLQTVFRFMHVFTSRVEDADAVGIYVVESTAHDEEAMNTLKPLFDGVVHTDADGEVALQLPGRSGPVDP